MNHVTKTIKTEQLSDGQFSVTVQCCDDPLHISTLTMAPELVHDETERMLAIEAHHSKVAKQHHAALLAKEHLESLVDTHEKTHSF